MKKALFFILLLIPIYSFAQDQDTITYYNKYWEEVCCKDSAYFYKIGLTDHGIFENGEITDYFNKSGKVQMTVKYLNWEKHGACIWYYENGTECAVGNYVYGEFSMLKAWDKNGNKTVSEGNGKITWYFEGGNGNIKSTGSYFNGRRNGVWYYYNPNGKIIEEINYFKGLAIMVSAWDNEGEKKIVEDGDGVYLRKYSNEKIASIGQYKNGIKTGEWKYYYANGLIESSGKYRNGIQVGYWAWYYNNGKKRKEGNFKEGNFDGEITWWYSDGIISSKGKMENGKRIGEWIWYDKEGYPISSRNYTTTASE